MAYTPSHNKIVPCRFGPHVRSRPAVAAALPRTSPQSVRHGYTPHQQSGQHPFLALCLSGLIGGGSQGRPSLTSPLQVEAIRSWTEAVRQPNVSIDTCLYVELYKRPTKVAPVLQSCQIDLHASTATKRFTRRHTPKMIHCGCFSFFGSDRCACTGPSDATAPRRGRDGSSSASSCSAA